MDKDALENIVFEHDFQKNDMCDVLKEVKLYIQRNKLILVGGMAIDLALRSVKSKLYPDDKYPDYDCYSSNFHVDAYNIANNLAKKYDSVSAIPAFHSSTMRVRVNFVESADITYVPKSLYSKIPTLKYQGFIIVHPHFQMIDQHRALSLPFENPPLETVFGRWKKDIVRYDLLYKSFPIKAPQIKYKRIRSISVSKELLTHNCMSGYTSLLYWVSLAKEEGFKKKCPEWMNSWKMTNTHVEIKLPENSYFNILSDDFDILVKKIGTPNAIFNPILDKVPKRSRIKNIEVLNNIGDKRGAHEMESDIYVSNLQEVMCYLLTLGIIYEDKTALDAYTTAHDILSWASTAYKDDKENCIKYLPTVDTYGKINSYDAHLISKEKMDVINLGKKRTIFTPKPAYPTKDKSIGPELFEYEPSKSIIYQFDGELIE